MLIGLSEKEIDESCPKDLEPFIKAHEFKRKQIDEDMYLQGVYFMRAIASVFNGKDSPYPEKPFLSNTRKEMTEEEKELEAERFMLKMDIIGRNFLLSKSDKSQG